jgi:hypothetical protein
MDRGQIGRGGPSAPFGGNAAAGKIYSFDDGGSVDTQQHRRSRGIHLNCGRNAKYGYFVEVVGWSE